MRTEFAWMIGLILAAVPTAGLADDWLQFRGASGGVSSESLPTFWGPSSNVQWKVKIPGVAWSAPIVLGDSSETTTYATPFVWRNKARTEIVALGSPKVRSYDPATGDQLWELTIGNGRCSATPVGNADMLYVGLDGSRGPDRGEEDGNNAGGMFAVRPGASGNLDEADSDTGVAWNARQDGPVMASPLVYEGHVYIFSHNGGIVTCLNADNGKRVYRKKLPDAKSFWSSPWAGGGKIYCLDDSGTTFVLKSGPEYELVSQNKLDEMTWASTAAADGSIFVRSVDYLYCISE